jgi:hypothetical protein
MSGTMLVLAPMILITLAVAILSSGERIPGRSLRAQARQASSDEAGSAAWHIAFIALVASVALDSLYLLDGAVLHAAPLALALAGAAAVQACSAAAVYLACRRIRVVLHRFANVAGLAPADRNSGAPDKESGALLTLWVSVALGSRAPPFVTSLA